MRIIISKTMILVVLAAFLSQDISFALAPQKFSEDPDSIQRMDSVYARKAIDHETSVIPADRLTLDAVAAAARKHNLDTIVSDKEITIVCQTGSVLRYYVADGSVKVSCIVPENKNGEDLKKRLKSDIEAVNLMTEPVIISNSTGNNNRPTSLRIDKNVLGLIHHEDIEGIKRLVSKNPNIERNKRTGSYRLKHPFTVKWGADKITIGTIYAKGVLFDSKNKLLAHYGSGFPRYMIAVTSDGRLSVKRHPTGPEGACLLGEAEREFLIMSDMHADPYFRENDIMAKFPIGVARFPGIFYEFPGHSDRAGEREEVGAILYGANNFQNLRYGKISPGQSKNFLDKDGPKAGSMLSAMHRRGITQRWLHSGNFMIFDRIKIPHDLGLSRSISRDKLGPRIYIAEILGDLYYAVMQLDEREGTEYAQAFSSGYFGYFAEGKNMTAMIRDVFRLGKDKPVYDIDHPLVEWLKANILSKAFDSPVGAVSEDQTKIITVDRATMAKFHEWSTKMKTHLYKILHSMDIFASTGPSERLAVYLKLKACYKSLEECTNSIYEAGLPQEISNGMMHDLAQMLQVIGSIPQEILFKEAILSDDVYGDKIFKAAYRGIKRMIGMESLASRIRGAFVMVRTPSRSGWRIDLEMSVKDPPASAQASVATTAPENGLLDKVYIEDDMAVKSVVNPDDKPLTGIYGAAGTDISNFLLSTNAARGIFIARYKGLKKPDLERAAQLLESFRQAKPVNADYVFGKKRSGYGVNTGTGWGIANITEQVAYELAFLDVKSITVREDSKARPEIVFMWAYPGQPKRERVIKFVDADMKETVKYADILEEAVHIYYQRAAEDLPGEYAKSDNYISRIADSLEDGGYLVTDDYTTAGGYFRRPAGFPLGLSETAVPGREDRVPVVYKLRYDPAFNEGEGPDSLWFHYGWRVAVRQKGFSGDIKSASPGMSAPLSRPEREAAFKTLLARIDNMLADVEEADEKNGEFDTELLDNIIDALSNTAYRLQDIRSNKEFTIIANLLMERVYAVSESVDFGSVSGDVKESYDDRLFDIRDSISLEAANRDIDMDAVYEEYLEAKEARGERGMGGISPEHKEGRAEKNRTEDRDDKAIEKAIAVIEEEAKEIAEINDRERFNARLYEFRAESWIPFIYEYDIINDNDLSAKFGKRQKAISDLLKGAYRRMNPSPANNGILEGDKDKTAPPGMSAPDRFRSASDGGDIDNPFIRRHIASGRVVEVSAGGDIKAVTLAGQMPRAPPISAERNLKEYGLPGRIESARDPGLLKLIIDERPNFRYLSEDEKERLVALAGQISITIHLDYAWVVEENRRMLASRVGWNKELLDLGPTIHIGELLLREMDARNIAQAILEEGQHIVKHERILPDGTRVNLDVWDSTVADPYQMIHHDPVFMRRVYDLILAATNKRRYSDKETARFILPLADDDMNDGKIAAPGMALSPYERNFGIYDRPSSETTPKKAVLTDKALEIRSAAPGMKAIGVIPPGAVDIEELKRYATGFDDTIEFYRQAFMMVPFDFSSLEKNGRVLDVGTGIGAAAVLLKKLGAAEVTGIDAHQESIKIARELALARSLDIRFETGDATDLHFGSGEFDLVTTGRMLEFLSAEQRRAALKEMQRVIKPGGAIILMAYHDGTYRRYTSQHALEKDSDYTEVWKDGYWDEAAWQRELETAGFTYEGLAWVSEFRLQSNVKVILAKKPAIGSPKITQNDDHGYKSVAPGMKAPEAGRYGEEIAKIKSITRQAIKEYLALGHGMDNFALNYNPEGHGPYWASTYRDAAELLAYAGAKKGDTILDVGHGAGDTISFLSHIFGLKGKGVEVVKEHNDFAVFLRDLMVREGYLEDGQVDLENKEFQDPGVDFSKYDFIYYFCLGTRDKSDFLAKLLTIKSGAKILMYGSYEPFIERKLTKAKGFKKEVFMGREDLGRGTARIYTRVGPAAVSTEKFTGADPRAFLKNVHNLTRKFMKEHAIAPGSRIILSETLFTASDAEQLRSILRAKFADKSPVLILPADKIRAAVNKNPGKGSVGCVLSKDDYDDPKLWNKRQEKATVLVLGQKLDGDRYLHVEGVVGLVYAMMAGDAGSDAVNRYIKLIFKKVDGLDTAELAELLVRDPRGFADKVRFKPVDPADVEGLDQKNRIAVETYLISA